MKKILFYLGWKLQNLGFRLRLLFEASRQKSIGWSHVPSVVAILREPYAHEVVLLAQRFADPHKTYTLVDVGANIGSWSRRFLRYLPGHYIGFEPDPIAFAKLQANHPGKILLNKCVGNTAGGVAFNLNEDSTYSSKYAYDDRIEQRAVQHTLQIEQITLDDCDLGEAPYILKVDVQGGELEVLQGALKTLSRTSMLILEVPLFCQTQASNSLGDIVTFLHAAGFQPCYFCYGGVFGNKNTVPIEHDIIFLNVRMIDPVTRIL